MQKNFQYTVVAGTPVNLATGVSFASRPPTTGDIIFAWQISIQMKHGGTGLGYVMDGVAVSRLTGPVVTNSNDLSLELGPATSTAPGGQYSKIMQQGQDRAGIAIHEIWIDGSNSGDIIIVSFDQR